MAEVKYKSLIPKFNSQEEMDSCQSIKITTSSNIDDSYKLFDKNEKTYINIKYRINIVFEFKNKVNLKKIFFKATERSPYNSNDYINFYVSSNRENWNRICVFPGEESEKIIENDECYKYYKMDISYAYGGNVHEIDLFTIDNSKFLIKQNNDYYSLKSNFYCIGQPQSNTELESWYEKYGSDEPNVLLEPINKEQINMSLDEATQIWSTDKPIDFNRIKDTIELIEEGNSKSIQYDISPYRIYDRLNSDAILTMATDKENN